MFHLRLKSDRYTTIAVVFIVIASCLVIVSSVQMSRYSNVFNCDDMSLECAIVLKLMGVGSEMVYVQNSDGSKAHCFLRVGGWLPVEATTLCPFSPLITHNGWEEYRVVQI